MIRDRKTRRVLIIEDNPGDFIIVEDMLKEQIPDSFAIVHARNFEQASSLLKHEDHSFDIILLDLTLPDKTGQHLVSELLQFARSCPVIILTGYGDIAFSIKSISLGVADYLIKDDLDPTSLYKSMLYSIERRRIIFQLEESEKRYSDLFHLSPQPMWVYDLATFKFLDVNKVALRHYGYSLEEFKRMGLNDLESGKIVRPSPRGVAPKGKEERIRAGSGVYHHQKKNGEMIKMEFQANAIVFEGKNAEIVAAHDITELTKYIGTVEDQNKRLREIAWEQSHIVRAPLSRMMGLVDLINHHELGDTERSELLNHFLDSAIELDNVIKNISEKAGISS